MYTITHELRTPTTSIKYMLKEIRATHNPNDMEHIEIADNNCDLLLSLINDILDYAKIEEGKVKLTYTYFSPKEKLLQCKNIFYI